MSPIKRIMVDITAENLWFVERYLNVFDFADIFPADAFSNGTSRGVPVTLHTDAGFDIVSDIDRTKMQLRNRSKHHGWTRWVQEKGLREGDRIVVEKVGEREFWIGVERNSNSD